MEPLSVIKDVDIFENKIIEPKFYKLRSTVKAIVVDGLGAVALLSTRGHGLFPGRGINHGENHEQALLRECMEEMGCEVSVVSYIGRFDQYRAHTAKKYEIHFYIAYVIGEKKHPTTTDASEREVVLTWETVLHVKNILEEQIANLPFEEYASQFNCRTHFLAFQQFLEITKFDEEVAMNALMDTSTIRKEE